MIAALRKSTLSNAIELERAGERAALFGMDLAVRGRGEEFSLFSGSDRASIDEDVARD